MPARPTTRRRHLQAVPTPHLLLTTLFPPLKREEVEVAAERVKAYGQREPIEVLDGAIVAGLVEYQACVEAGVIPEMTSIEAPEDLVEYVVRRNVPRHLSTLERACIAVLAQVEFKNAGRLRMREGGRVGGSGKGKPRDERSRPFAGERWWQAAARVVGSKPGAVRSLAALHMAAPDVFDAVWHGRITVLMEAKDLASQSAWLHGEDPNSRRVNPAAKRDRAEVLRRYEASGRAAPIRALMYELKRERRVRELPPPTPKGRRYQILLGRDEEQARHVRDGSVDLIVADILYGTEAPAHARRVAKIARLVLVDGGTLALMPGHEALPEVLQECLPAGLHFLAVGYVSYDAGSSGEGLRGKGIVDRPDCDPVLFFSTAARPQRRIDHLHFPSTRLDKRYGTMQKPLDAMLDLVSAACGKGGIVMDPCCGWGSTGEAALRSGMTFVGVEIDPERARISASRLAEVERELAESGGGDAGSRLVKTRRTPTNAR